MAPYRGPLSLVALAVVVSAALTSIAPFLTRAVFDKALFPPGGPPDLRLLTWLVLGLIAIPVVSAAIGIGQNYLTAKVGNEAMADLRGELFAHLQTMELAFFTSTKTGAIQSRLANDVNGVRTVLTSTATTILANVVTVGAALVSMVLPSWQLTVITLILLPLFVVVQIRVGRRRQRLARRTQESLAEMTAITEESLSVSGILLAKVFDRADAETRRYRRENRRQTRLQVKAAMAGQSFFALVGTFFAITPAIIYFAAGQMLDDSVGGLTAGTVIAFTTLQARLQGPLMQLMRVTLDVQTSLALFRRIFEYLDLEPAITERPDAVVLDPAAARGEVELRGVWFRYPAPRPLLDVPSGRSGRRGGPGPGPVDNAPADAPANEPADAPANEPDDAPAPDPARWILTDLSLRVRPGQFAAIVGPSGSGKTTTTYLVPRFYDVDRGACLLDGIDVRDLTLSSLAQTVGMVTQEPYLFHGTIRENIAYARPDAGPEQIEQAARDANIHDRIMSFELGYDTVTGERGYRLSGGEKQRLAIARVLLMNPRVLILDEATSALDTETERLVQEALARAARDRTTIAIAHRLSTIMAADVIFALEGGRLVESGTHAELLARRGLYWRLYTEQFGGGKVEGHFADGVVYTDGTVLCDRGPHRHSDLCV
ncbi:ABC transporter ATP-binding protein [Catenulispora yoronensis]|uniref:ABC transporter ATP-binding protein n=1 Tax=Catenulispora yoronensis TaxID=450799 RepID=UPI0031D6CA00